MRKLLKEMFLTEARDDDDPMELFRNMNSEIVQVISKYPKLRRFAPAEFEQMDEGEVGALEVLAALYESLLKQDDYNLDTNTPGNN